MSIKKHMSDESIQILFKLLNKFQKTYFDDCPDLEIRFATIRYLLRDVLLRKKGYYNDKLLKLSKSSQ